MKELHIFKVELDKNQRINMEKLKFLKIIGINYMDKYKQEHQNYEINK